VIDSESVSQLALFLRESLTHTNASTVPSIVPSTAPSTVPSTDPSTPSHPSTPSPLYACLHLLEPSPHHEAARSPDPLLAIARDFSPRIMRLSDTEVLLDVSGLGRLIGEPPAIAKELRRAAQEAGLSISVAMAQTQTAARLLAAARPDPFSDSRVSRFPDCAIARLLHLPVTALQPLETLPPGINHRDRARPYEIFESWGIATLGDLTALPAADLSSRLGRRGVALQRLARGWDPRPFVPDADTPRYIGRLELEWPIEALEPLSFVLARLLEPLSAALDRADRGAAAIRLDLRLTDRQIHARVLQLPAPMRDARVLRTLLLLDLESHPSPAAVDVVSIELDPAPARITQFSLLERALPSPETVSTLTARLSALVGETRVGSAALIDTHQPGAFEMRRYAPEQSATDGAQGNDGGDGADADRVVLRRQRLPPAIRVRLEHGRPVYLATVRRGMPSGIVTQAAGPWRRSGGWWASPPDGDLPRAADLPPDRPRPRRSAEALSAKAEGGSHGVAARAFSRDEWDVALTSGVTCRIFQDRTTERWFLEGVYD
jgi:nucleotidyltransferase/DNA polymerase involved in DNA repair